MRNNHPPAVDPITEFVPLEIDGRTYELVYDFDAIANAEKQSDCNLLHGMSATLLNTMSAAQLRGLLWASLRRRQPKMTLADAAALCRLDTVAEIVPAIAATFTAAMPAKKAEAGSAAATKS